MTKPEYDADPQDWISYFKWVMDGGEATAIDFGKFPLETRRLIFTSSELRWEIGND